MADRFDQLNEILACARRVGLGPGEFRQAGPTRWKSILVEVLETFTAAGAANLGRVWIWEDFPEATVWHRGVESVETLHVLGSPELAVFCLMERRTDRKAGHWVFEGTLRGALAVAAELSFTEFCIVPTSLDWLVCENHHDMWIAVGDRAIEAIEPLALQRL